MLFHHRSPEYILVYLEQFTWSLFLHIHLSWAATCAGVSLSERVLIILCWWYRHIQPIFLVKTNYMMTRFSIPKIWNFFEFWFCEVETYTKVEYLETLWRVSLITSNHSMPSKVVSLKIWLRLYFEEMIILTKKTSNKLCTLNSLESRLLVSSDWTFLGWPLAWLSIGLFVSYDIFKSYLIIRNNLSNMIVILSN